MFGMGTGVALSLMPPGKLKKTEEINICVVLIKMLFFDSASNISRVSGTGASPAEVLVALVVPF